MVSISISKFQNLLPTLVYVYRRTLSIVDCDNMLLLLLFLIVFTFYFSLPIMAAFPPIGEQASPSLLDDLKVDLVTVEGRRMLNISWAVNVDASIEHLTGTRLNLDHDEYHCGYNPLLAKANLTGLKQVWFHYLVPASPGFNMIQVANLPLPPMSGAYAYKFVTISIPRLRKLTTVNSTSADPVETPATDPGKSNPVDVRTLAAIFGGVVGVMALTCCVLIYKGCGRNFAASLGFTKLPTTPVVPVSVLLVYPAENAAFQEAVVALAEFLQWHGGCRVSVDMWQQGKIAELGPMRWLAEQAKSADRVIIICPQPNHCPLSNGFLGYSIPASASDLYPLVLNMVAGHAKSPSELVKFWAVQLGKHQDERPSSQAVELRACKSFCLMKDLDKLCKSLHNQKQDSKKACGLKPRPVIAYSKNATVKLRDAIGHLVRHRPSDTEEVEPLNIVITSN
ncbi:uncharacterized protein il17rb isoform 2-T2 [Polymixia lowei]